MGSTCDTVVSSVGPSWPTRLPTRTCASPAIPVDRRADLRVREVEPACRSCAFAARPDSRRRGRRPRRPPAPACYHARGAQVLAPRSCALLCAAAVSARASEALAASAAASYSARSIVKRELPLLDRGAVLVALRLQDAAHPRPDVGVHVAVERPDRLDEQRNVLLGDLGDQHGGRRRRAGLRGALAAARQGGGGESAEGKELGDEGAGNHGVFQSSATIVRPIPIATAVAIGRGARLAGRAFVTGGPCRTARTCV